MLYPLKFKPVYKDYLWGGDSFEKLYNRETPGDIIAESWEVACHNNGMSLITNGPLAGKTLQEIYESNKEALLGSCADQYNKFPLLIKFIDAKNKLSVQVHPEDDYAHVNENGELGKNEMWYVLNAKEGSKLAIGLKDGVTKEQFAKGIEEGTVADLINEMPVVAGDVVNIPAGLLHAIQDGIMIAEVQQNSDTTYRVFDWNRVGTDGNPRPLHVQQALDVIDFEQSIPKEKCIGEKLVVGDNTLTKYIYNQYFGVEELDLHGIYSDSTVLDHMAIYMCVKGKLEVQWQDTVTDLSIGETVLIPACLGDFKLSGDAKLIKAFVPTTLTDTFYNKIGQRTLTWLTNKE